MKYKQVGLEGPYQGFPMAYKLEVIDDIIVERELTEEEYKKESLYAQEVLSSFLPKEKL